MNVYLGKAETKFVQGKPKGYVRDLVRREMTLAVPLEDFAKGMMEGKDVEEIVDERFSPPDVRDVHVWQPPEVRPPGLRKR